MKLRIALPLATMALAISFLCPQNAYAQEGTAQDEDQMASQGKDKSGVAIYDFEEDSIEGEVLSPAGEDMQFRRFGEHAALISIRTNFLQEMIQFSYEL